MDKELQFDGGPEEWLVKDWQLSRSLAIVPDQVAVALIAVGFSRGARMAR